MVTLNQRSLGLFLIAISIALIVILSFVKADLDERDSHLCEITHSNPNLEMTQCPAHTSNTSWYLTAGFGLAFLILGAGLYIVVTPSVRETGSKSKFREFDASNLDMEERKIYDFLIENEGSMYQSDLIKKTDFSKVKMTRLLDKLESKKVIDRKRRGMTNIIVLK